MSMWLQALHSASNMRPALAVAEFPRACAPLSIATQSLRPGRRPFPISAYNMLGHLAYISAATTETRATTTSLDVREQTRGGRQLSDLIQNETEEKLKWKQRAADADAEIVKLTQLLFAIESSSREHEQLVQQLSRELSERRDLATEIELLKSILMDLAVVVKNNRASGSTLDAYSWEANSESDNAEKPSSTAPYERVPRFSHETEASDTSSIAEKSTASDLSWVPTRPLAASTIKTGSSS